ncbi:hypothetical protein QO179_05285 [Bacillus stercoris]|nr:hypothetical protein [Bacillus stercoris]
MTNYQHELYFAHCHGHPKKPLEIYMFVDPLCLNAGLRARHQKLKIRYGRFHLTYYRFRKPYRFK